MLKSNRLTHSLLFVLMTCSMGFSQLEHGRFVLHKFEQAIGEETYDITRDADGVTAKIEFKFADRGTEVPLIASFRGDADLRPLSFEIKGKTSRLSDVDQAVTIDGRKGRLRSRDTWSDIAVPARYFTIEGYAPTTMQMLMMRYWTAHGSPAELPILPKGSVAVRTRGVDEISLGGKRLQLTRFTIEGLIWGRETLWFDHDQNLVAAITTDAEFDHFEAVREGFEGALGEFVARAGSDNMAVLAELGKGMAGRKSGTLALVGATLIDGRGGPEIPGSAVIVQDGRIAAAGARNKVAIPKGAEIVDVSGKTLLPGLWDMHAHFEQVEWGPIYLAAGVTTVRDCGNELEFIRAVRDAIADGRGLGPRLLLAGVVDGSGQYAIGVQRVDTPEQAKTWVDKYHDAGFQQMKIYSSVKLEELKAVADEAHRLGMTVTGHIPEGLNAFQAVEVGQDQINHIQYVADIMHAPLPAKATREEKAQARANVDLSSPEAKTALEFLKAHHTVVDPTMALMELMTGSTQNPPAKFEPGAEKLPGELAEQIVDVGPPTARTEAMAKTFKKYLEVLASLHKAGVPIVTGTDQGVPGHSLHREMELYVEAGFTPMEAIQAATLVPAQVMGLDKEVGTIETGRRADLIVIDGDPLKDIRNTRNVERVMTNGVMYETAPLWKSVGFRP